MISDFFRFPRRRGPRSSEERKLHSEKRLRKLGIPVNRHLPVIEEYPAARFRDSQAVVRRVIILSTLIDYIDGHDSATKTTTIDNLRDMELWDDVSDAERQYLQSIDTSEQTEINLSWRNEAVNVFLWSLGIIEELSLPINTADLGDAHKRVQTVYSSISDFISNATFRNYEEILDETDFIYRAHWAVRNAQTQGKQAPANFNSSVVYERHCALNWLTCYAEDWDDITCDT